MIRRALLSVSDKTGLVEFATGLASFGIELISTGGTRATLAAAGLTVRDITDVTGFPEILDGRVKTLHPHVHAGLLSVRSDPTHMATLADRNIAPIDLVCVNLYPFERTVAKTGATHEEIVENIDVGGPSMLRAAAKNYESVVVVSDPAQYGALLDEMRGNGGATLRPTRERLAGEAFARTAAYDAAIAKYFAFADMFPPSQAMSFTRKSLLRYGENPHQSAAFYVERLPTGANVSSAEVLGGKELSYNNILDLDSALNLVREFGEPAAVIIKHNNPCGAATSGSLAEAFAHAYEGDPLSAYGGVLAFNRDVDEATASLITEPNRFVEAVIAPGYCDAALKLLTTRPKWGKNVRLLCTGPLGPMLPAMDYRRVDGGLLVQARDRGSDDFASAKVVTNREPSPAEWADLLFGWLVCKHVKSNAIVFAKGGRVVGVGAGQMSRVDSVEIAGRKAGERSHGSVLASDAFFPFRDNVDLAAKAGITAIVQPGGSLRDADSIAACNEHGIAMVFTGVRYFRH
ncbi:MAG: bifunctional phosphoribosylaminoimidazolecarboxamide formyltransferase/IMP cyclohydrolase [Gemmataceae bacterium]